MQVSSLDEHDPPSSRPNYPAIKLPWGPPPGTYWMTRSRRRGELDDRVEVWSAFPDARLKYPDGDVEWLTDTKLMDVPGARVFLGTWSVDEARSAAGVAPETDRECVRVGREAE